MKNIPSLTIAQLSDCHLYADRQAKHLGANVYDNLVRVLMDIKAHDDIDIVIFTGDLSQDHTEQSYQQFIHAWQHSQLDLPLLFLPGNHDHPAQLQQALSSVAGKKNASLRLFPSSSEPSNIAQMIENPHWQFILLNSKSDTPAGQIDVEQLQQISANFSASKYQLIFMHHHPVDVGYFIDQHGLQNQHDFWQIVNAKLNVKAIACGHIHRGLTIKAAHNPFLTECTNVVDVYTCPATSVQFETHATELRATTEGPGYRLFELFNNGDIHTEIVMLPALSES